MLLEPMRARYSGEGLLDYTNFAPSNVPERIGGLQTIRTAEGRAGIDNLIEELKIVVDKSNQTKKDSHIMPPLRWASELNFLLEEGFDL